MFKYTANTLKKLELIFKEAEFVIRYERGNFNAGYCILENKNVVVINKFYAQDARINCLVEILPQIELDKELLTEKSLEMYEQIIEMAKKTENN